MNKTSWKKALLSAALCVAILTAMAPVGLVEAKADTTISDLNSQYDKLQQQVNALQNKIDQAKTEKAKQQAIKNKTTQDITITKQQIAVLEAVSYTHLDVYKRQAGRRDHRKYSCPAGRFVLPDNSQSVQSFVSGQGKQSALHLPV